MNASSGPMPKRMAMDMRKSGESAFTCTVMCVNGNMAPLLVVAIKRLMAATILSAAIGNTFAGPRLSRTKQIALLLGLTRQEDALSLKNR